LLKYFFTEDDWEIAHRKLTGIQNEDAARKDFDEWLRRKGLESEHDDPNSKLSRTVETANDDDSENELDREEVVSDFTLGRNTCTLFCPGSSRFFYVLFNNLASRPFSTGRFVAPYQTM